MYANVDAEDEFVQDIIELEKKSSKEPAIRYITSIAAYHYLLSHKKLKLKTEQRLLETFFKKKEERK
jgi:hypothetical protein